MRRLVAAAGFLAIVNFPVPSAWSATDAQPEKPRVYALVSAVGEQFTVMTQTYSTGTHLPPYRGASVKVRDNFLNLSVLRSLDKAVEEKDPGSKRVFMALPSNDMDAAAKWEREDVALSEVEAALKVMPERAQWDRIVVATPAYHSYEANGLGGRLIGFGIFYQPICRRPRCREDSFYATTGAVTPDEQPIRTTRFVAPYAFIDIWVLDAKTFAVIDKQRTYDHVKVFNPESTSLRIDDNVSAEDQSKFLFKVLEHSVGTAVAHSDVLNKSGVINVGAIKEVKSENDGN